MFSLALLANGDRSHSGYDHQNNEAMYLVIENEALLSLTPLAGDHEFFFSGMLCAGKILSIKFKIQLAQCHSLKNVW